MYRNKPCIYCGCNNLENMKYCGYCGLPFSEGEIPVEEGNVFQPEGPKSAQLSFSTKLPGIWFGGEFYPFKWHTFYKSYMRVQFERMITKKDQLDEKKIFNR